MKLHPEDPRLTAWLLGELTEQDAAEVAGAVEADPALAEAVRDLQAVRITLRDSLSVGTVSLSADQRAEILAAARAAEPPVEAAPAGARVIRWKPFLIPLAAAAAVALLIPFGNRPDEPASPAVASQAPAANSSTASPAAPTEAAPPEVELPAARPGVYPVRRALAATEFPSIDLPVVTGTSSLAVVRDSIRKERKLPAPELVRLEEILNGVPLRPAGMASIARIPADTWHPDGRNAGQTQLAASLAAETIPCPWKPSATLILVSIRGNSSSECTVKATFRTDPSKVRGYRLLGFDSSAAPTGSTAPAVLAPNRSTTLAIEVEPVQGAGDLGAIEWTVNDKPSPGITLVRNPDSEPSDDARFGALLCTYAQWLAKDRPELVDAELLAALAREIASAGLPDERADFLQLIDQSLKL